MKSSKITNRTGSKLPAPAGSARGVSLVQRMRSVNRFREQYNPLRGLTLSRAVQLGEAYFRGEMADLQWAFFWIEQTDADLLALIECRLGRLLEMDYNIKQAQHADERLAEEQQQCLQEKFEAIDNLYEAVEHLGMAPFRGFAHCEQWHTNGELTHLEVVNQWNCVRDGLYGPWKYNPEARSTTFRGLPADAIMPPEQFLYRQVWRPINRIALFKFVRANLSEKDWDAFVEIFGIPNGVVIGPANVPEGKEAEYEAAAEAIAEGGSGYLPNGSDYKPNVAPRGTSPFKERLTHLTEKLVLAGTGGKLTMLTEAGSGTLAGGAHTDVFKQIARADARRISETFTKQLVKGWLNAEFPGKPHVAYFELAANEEADTAKTVAEIKTLSDAGYQIDPEEVSERTGYTVTLKAPPPAAVPGVEPAAIPNRASAAAAGRELLFAANSARRLSAAQLDALRPLLARLAEIEQAADADVAALVAKLKADLPDLEAAAVKQLPAIAEVWHEILGTAFVDGVVSAAETRAVEPIKTAKPAPSVANSARKRTAGPCKGRARASSTR